MKAKTAAGVRACLRGVGGAAGWEEGAGGDKGDDGGVRACPREAWLVLRTNTAWIGLYQSPGGAWCRAG